MDDQKADDKTIKRIVPIRGNLLEKLKNKIQKNGLPSNTLNNDTIVNNNNINANVISTCDSNSDLAKQKKVIIQKVEKVKLETIHFLGPPRRISKLFETEIASDNEKEEKTECTNAPAVIESVAPAKILSAKMPENNFNTVVPLKMIRTIRPPKPVPNFPKRRFGLVQIHKLDDAIDAPENVVSNNCEMEITTEQLDEKKTSVVKEEQFLGFEEENEQREHLLTTALKRWLECLKKHNAKESEEIVAEPSADIKLEDVTMKTEFPAKSENCKSEMKEEDIENVKETQKGESRIKEIDSSLKEIPNIVTGNNIEAENVELKLIINYLLRQLNVSSITEILNLKPPTYIDHSSKEYLTDEFSSGGFEENSSSFESQLSEDDEKQELIVADVKTVAFENPLEQEMKNNCNIDDVIENITPTLNQENEQESKRLSVDSEADKTLDLQSQSTRCIKEEDNMDINYSEPTDDKITNSHLESTEKVQIENLESRKRKCILNPLATSTVKKAKPNEEKISKTKPEITCVLRSSSREPDHVIVKSNHESSASEDLQPAEKRQRQVHHRVLRSLSREPEHERVIKSNHESSASEDTEKRQQQRHHRVLRSSSREKEKISGVTVAEKKKKVTRVEELKHSESDSNSSDIGSKINKSKREQNSPLAKKGTANETEGVVKRRGRKKKAPIDISNNKKVERTPRSKIIYSSDSDDDISQRNNNEFKSDSSDLNSNHKSSILERNDYLKFSSLDKRRNKDTSLQPLISKLKTAINERRKYDRAPMKAPIVKKRPYLRTSAFTGNHENSQVTSDKPKEPSVSRDNSVEKIIDTNSTTKSTQIEPKRIETRGRKKTVLDHNVKRKIFTQEPVEKPIEHMVPYDSIVDSIRFAPVKKIGRLSAAAKREEEENQRLMKIELEKLEYFSCGNCKNRITKHKWRDHVIEHGGIAWLENFEPAIDINEWNESLRRLINCMKFYKLDAFNCPNCKLEKKSALGHMSHVYVCCEDETTIEARKMQCPLCEERIMPQNMGAHKMKCMTSKYEVVEATNDDGDDEEEEETENLETSTGRLKRRAVKRAEKSFKKILKEEKDDDYEFSSSDASIHEEESSETETEGSSGVEESDVQTEEDEESDECSLSFLRKGKATVTDSQELKHNRKVIASFIESLPRKKFHNTTLKWTRNYFNTIHTSEKLLNTFLPDYQTHAVTIQRFMTSLKFETKSMKYAIEKTGAYSRDFGKCKNITWKEIDVGENHANEESLTFFCGGSVSSIDWAPSDSDTNYLAIACNNRECNKSLNLMETSKSYVQIVAFESLLNTSFDIYENSQSNLYSFVVSEGPIWSVRFHPRGMLSDQRIGLLAVSTANQNILVYSLPYLKTSDKSLIISIKSILICKLSEEVILYQDNYLLQATTVCWHHQENFNLLAGGYVSGLIAIWKLTNEHEIKMHEENSVYPLMVFQPHFEMVTAIDFKYTLSQIHMLVASMERKVKVFRISNHYEEITTFHSNSRVNAAEWWINWPGFLIANDNSYGFGGIFYRPALEIGMRSSSLLQNELLCVSDVNINHWLNYVAAATTSGEVITFGLPQMLRSEPKKRWEAYRTHIVSFADYLEIPNDSEAEIGVIFHDSKSKTSKRENTFRDPPVKYANVLQINQIRFNRNEKSCRFYALGYETGFVRIKHLKNFK